MNFVEFEPLQDNMSFFLLIWKIGILCKCFEEMSISFLTKMCLFCYIFLFSVVFIYLFIIYDYDTPHKKLSSSLQLAGQRTPLYLEETEAVSFHMSTCHCKLDGKFVPMNHHLFVGCGASSLFDLILSLYFWQII